MSEIRTFVEEMIDFYTYHIDEGFGREMAENCMHSAFHDVVLTRPEAKYLADSIDVDVRMIESMFTIHLRLS